MALNSNNLNKLIATIHSIDANLQCVILKEEDVNTPEKIGAIKTQADDVIRVLDCATVSANVGKLLFTEGIEYEPKYVIIYCKDKTICTLDSISKTLLRSVLHGNEMLICQICEREYGEREKRRSCNQCAFNYCYNCGVRMTMQAIINGFTTQGYINCPQCRAGENILFGTVLDDNLRVKIPEKYYTPFVKHQDLNDIRGMTLNMLAALLLNLISEQDESEQDVYQTDLIEELITCKENLPALH